MSYRFPRLDEPIVMEPRFDLAKAIAPPQPYVLPIDVLVSFDSPELLEAIRLGEERMRALAHEHLARIDEWALAVMAAHGVALDDAQERCTLRSETSAEGVRTLRLTVDGREVEPTLVLEVDFTQSQ